MTKNESIHQTSIDKGIKKEAAKPLDGGWGWIVVLGSFGINFVCMGAICTFGILHTQFLNEFKEGQGYTSWIVSLMTAVSAISCIPSSFLVNLYGCRAVTTLGSIICASSLLISYYAQNVTTLLITIGLGMGTGMGFVYLPAIVIVNAYFEKYRSIAVGLAVAGCGCGTFLCAPIATYISHEYGWRWTLVALSGACLLMTVFGSTFRPLKSSTEEKTSNELKKDQKRYESQQGSQQEMLSFGLLKDPMFMLFAISNFTTCVGYYVPFFCLADRSIQHGMSHHEASQVISILGISNTLGRIFWGYVSDRPWLNRIWVFESCLIFAGFATISSVICSNYSTIAIYSATFGFLIGGYITLRSVILTDLLGLENLNNSFGLLLLFEAIGTVTGGPSVGFLHDQFGSYSYGFVFAGCMLILSGFLLFFMPMVQRKVDKNELERKLSV